MWGAVVGLRTRRLIMHMLDGLSGLGSGSLVTFIPIGFRNLDFILIRK